MSDPDLFTRPSVPPSGGRSPPASRGATAALGAAAAASTSQAPSAGSAVRSPEGGTERGTDLDPGELALIAWFADGERPHKLEWLDDRGCGLGLHNLRAGRLKTGFPHEPAGVDMVLLVKLAGPGLSSRRIAIELWRALAPYFTAGRVNVTGLALIAPTAKPKRRGA